MEKEREETEEGAREVTLDRDTEDRELVSLGPSNVLSEAGTQRQLGQGRKSTFFQLPTLTTTTNEEPHDLP